MLENCRDKYLGMINRNNQGYEMKVVGYDTYDHITVQFSPPYEGIVTSKMDHFKNGGIHNPFAPTVCGYGIVGSKYLTRDIQNHSKYGLEYSIWTNMIKRCVDEKTKEKCPTYKEVTCDPSWQYYENFYEWIHQQSNFERLKSLSDINLDKDILEKGNKIYSPDKCTLVPRKVNNLLLTSKAIRGNYPIGVRRHKQNNKFVAVEGGYINSTYLGSYDTPEEAFEAYKQFKTQRIKQIADDEFNRGNITEKCYNALINYKIEITD